MQKASQTFHAGGREMASIEVSCIKKSGLRAIVRLPRRCLDRSDGSSHYKKILFYGAIICGKSERLFLDQAGMAGDALPSAAVEHPGVGEASNVIVGFALKAALGLIDAGNDCGIAEEVHFDILNGEAGRLELRVFDVGEELGLVAERSIPLGVDEALRHQRVQSRSVAINLRLVPQALKYDEFGFARIDLLSCNLPEYDDDK